MSEPLRVPWICLPIASELGEFRATYSDVGLAQLRFPSDKTISTAAKHASVPAEIQRWHHVTSEAVNAILSGRKPKAFPPFDLSSGTAFQQRVWRAMMRIPFGQTSSYGELASAIGNAKAVRAVGGACGANPIPVLVPCHRVLAANHKLGGFSGGVATKRELLRREGVTLI
jgi:methylated-DNA-[protein]-cysteine S-methyltransferase